MKKTAICISLVSILFSCKKNYDCECTTDTTTTVNSNSVKTTDIKIVTVKERSKIQADTKCTSMHEFTESGTNSNGAHSEMFCTLK